MKLRPVWLVLCLSNNKSWMTIRLWRTQTRFSAMKGLGWRLSTSNSHLTPASMSMAMNGADETPPGSPIMNEAQIKVPVAPTDSRDVSILAT